MRWDSELIKDRDYNFFDWNFCISIVNVDINKYLIKQVIKIIFIS